MNSQKRASGIIFLVVFLLIALYAVFRKRSLENNFALATGYIYELGSSRHSSNTIFFKYRFVLNGVTYTGNSGMPCDRKKEIYFQSWKYGIRAQVAYHKKSPGNNELLLTKEDYKAYGLSIPEWYKEKTQLIDSLCTEE